MKPKYRIVKITRIDGTIYYSIQKKFLWFFWIDIENFNTLESANQGVSRLPKKINVVAEVDFQSEETLGIW